MCGVVAELRFDGSSPAVSVHEAQLGTLRHRGPDAEGYARLGPAIIGQSRLRVMDTQRGDPPVTTPDGRITVSLNGEIYNFRQLREGLRTRGHAFTSESDTEVVAHMLAEFGAVEAARRMDGMFAIAAWDQRLRQLILIRDRFGEKPLFFAQRSNGVVVASEIKALVAHPDVSSAIDETVIPDYLSLGYVPAPRTIYSAIQSAPPAHVITFAEDGVKQAVEYWSLGHVAPSLRSPAEFAAATREAVTRAIVTRSSADRELGCFLSGGVDSSIIAAVLAAEKPRRLKTFTVGFSESQFDERPYASEVARHLGTEHHEIVLSPEIVALTEVVSLHHDQPFADSSSIPFYALAQYASEYVTVALSGDGGDEVFAGYQRFGGGLAVGLAEQHPAAWRLLKGVATVARRPRQVLKQAGAVEAGLPTAFRRWIAYTSDDDVRRLCGRDPGAWEQTIGLWHDTQDATLLKRLMRLNFDTYLAEDLLVKADRMAMAHSLEVRNPYLATDLVELAFSMPDRELSTISQQKRVLKEAFRHDLPAGVFTRRKQGFGIPLDEWFRGDLGVFAGDRLGPHARVRKHLDGAIIDELLGSQRAGTRDNGSALWTLLMLELFLRRTGN